MDHIYKLNGRRVVLDCARGIAYPVSSLALKIVEAITPPLTAECPTSLRYAFAKYDSRDLNQAYAEVYTLYQQGILHFDEKSPAPQSEVLYTEITASADDVTALLQKAVADGSHHLLVTVHHATIALTASLLKTFENLAQLRLIVEIPLDTLTDDDIRFLSDHAVYLYTDGTFPPALDTFLARGVHYISTDFPAENRDRQAEKLLRSLNEKRQNGQFVDYAPFTFALYPKHTANDAMPACAECFARQICRGSRLAPDGSQTTACEREKLLIKCAAVDRMMSSEQK